MERMRIHAHSQNVLSSRFKTKETREARRFRRSILTSQSQRKILYQVGSKIQTTVP